MACTHARAARRRHRGPAAGPPARSATRWTPRCWRSWATRWPSWPPTTTLRVLVISTTNERALCAGADVAEELDPAGGVARMEALRRALRARSRRSRRRRSPSASATASARAPSWPRGCDLRVGGDNLKLVLPGARLGVPVGPARLVPLVGLAKARRADLHRPHRRRRGGRRARPPGPPRAGRRGRGGGARAGRRARRPSRRRACADLKQLFRDYEDTAARVARENGEIVEFQRTRRRAAATAACGALTRALDDLPWGRGRRYRIRPLQGHGRGPAHARASRSSSSAATG